MFMSIHIIMFRVRARPYMTPGGVQGRGPVSGDSEGGTAS